MLFFLFPIFTIVIFSTLTVRWALVLSITVGYLLLPSQDQIFLNLPILPSLDKISIPSFIAAIAASMVIKRQGKFKKRRREGVYENNTSKSLDYLPGYFPRSSFAALSMLLLAFGVTMTTITNSDTLIYGETVIPGQRIYDLASNGLGFLVALLPMLLGRKFLFDENGHKILMSVMFLSAMIYSLPALYEVRMSPQINRMVYGFFPHSFGQHMRAGGFRPLVFLNHGLLLGIYLCCSILAAAVLFRVNSGSGRIKFLFGILYLISVLFLAKTLGALIITIFLLPVALFFSVRLQLLTAALIAGITLAYPILRGADIIRTEAVVQIAEGINSERADSLAFRFRHENALLDKAADRPVFGWSSWGRWRVFDENGRDVTVSDGEWVITISRWGWVGYISIFGLLCFPIIQLALSRRKYEVGLATSGLCVLLSANLIDLLPNASTSPAMWLAAGALVGRLEYARGFKAVSGMENKNRTVAEGLAVSYSGGGGSSRRYSRFSARQHERQR
jgi:hypothetical protein